MRLILLFTTFPLRTETFLQREVEALIEAKRDIEIWSFWGGRAEFRGLPIHRTSLGQLWRLMLALPYWFVRSPKRFRALWGGILTLQWRNMTNFGENVLGVFYGCILARSFERSATGETVLHAVWASMPATVGWTIHHLTEIPFSFAGHAYDLFEDGGDGLIRQKLACAFALRTSTAAGATRLMALGADEAAVSVIRRGLSEMPAFAPKPTLGECLQLAVVGRFVAKMGYGFLFEILAYLHAQGLSFKIRIIGEGPGQKSFQERARQTAWSRQIELLGAQPFEKVHELLQWSDALLFTGRVAASGDQAGFPNIIAEAMALGRSVITTVVGGVPEVIHDRLNGHLAASPETFHAALLEVRTHNDRRLMQLAQARSWVEKHFDAHANMAAFWTVLEAERPEGRQPRKNPRRRPSILS